MDFQPYTGEDEHLVLYLLAIYISSSLHLSSFSIYNSLNCFWKYYTFSEKKLSKNGQKRSLGISSVADLGIA